MLYLQARVPKPKDRQVSGGFPGPLLRREWLRGALRDINQARMNARPFLEDLFAAAVAAAHPSTCLAPYLPAPPPDGRLIVLAAGKAGGSMIEVAERHYLDERNVSPDRLAGLAVTRHGYGRPTRLLPVIEAGHPGADQASVDGAARALALADAAQAGDLVLVL